MKLVWSAEHENLRFFLQSQDGGETLPFDLWLNVGDGEIYAQAILIRELVENGQAEIHETAVCIPHEEIVQLSSIDQQLLDLPPPFPFDIKVLSSGTLNQSDFKFKWGFFENPHGQEIFAERQGAILTPKDGSQYLLSLHQLALCNALDEFNSLPLDAKEFGPNLRRFADIKTLSKKSAVVLDEYLENETVSNPATIGVKLRQGSGDTLELLPQLEGIDEEQFEKKFDRFPNVRAVYSLEDQSGRRTRVAFTEAQQRELRKIKQNRRVSGQEKQWILQQPQEIFDPEVIDLDSFSSRVVEIGLYKPRFYPFVCPYKSQWVPGVILESSPEDRKQILFETQQKLEDFKKAQIESVKKGEEKMNWQGLEIPVREAGKIIRMAERQFKDPSKPVKPDKDKNSEVLIIKENIDSLDYAEFEDEKKPATDRIEELPHCYFYPPNLKNSVRVLSHQQEGIAWLQALCGNTSGGLLADDMGLGKTLQILAFIDWHNRNGNDDGRPYLIVAPVSLLENWETERIKFFNPSSLIVLNAYGGFLSESKSDESRQRILKELNKPQIVLTTYETLRIKQLLLCAIDWAIVVLDEAQKIKTPGTLVTNAAKALKAGFKIAATGTPVENTLVDLWCIVDFLVPGLLGSAKDFARQFQQPLKGEDIDVKELGERLRERVGVHIKRRLKSDILHDLPPKRIKLERYEMPATQFERYELEIARAREIDATSPDSRGQILSALHAMRDISDHPFLADKQIDHFSADELIEASAKLKASCDILESIGRKEEKVVIFAHRRDTQRMLAKVLAEKCKVKASIINGDTPVGRRTGRNGKETRQQAIDRFQQVDGFNAIIMSPLAAGFGLNVTAANHVIHYSRHWNPAKEDQATDRVYRIGQDKDVYVYIPMAVTSKFKSFDVILDELLERKRTLSSASLFPTERAEVRPEELYRDAISFDAAAPRPTKLTMHDIDLLEAHLFEAAVAVLWEKLGYKTLLTPKSNDKGADVIAFSEKENILLQAKHSREKPIGDFSVGEILKSRGYYSDLYETDFKLAIITNRDLSSAAHTLAAKSCVQIYNRSHVEEYLQITPVTIYEVRHKEERRLS